MTEKEVRQTLYLLGTLWSNYKPPQEAVGIETATATWLEFFRAVPAEEVTRAIMEHSAAGAEFAPQVGQIYKSVKDRRAALPASNVDPEFRKQYDWIMQRRQICHDAGVLTLTEAMERGQTVAQWMEAAKDAKLHDTLRVSGWFDGPQNTSSR